MGLMIRLEGAVSVMNNIAEGYEAGGNVMFKKFLQISRGSCGEVRSMLYLAKDLKYIDEIKVNGLLSDCMVLSKGISKLIIYFINGIFDGQRLLLI